LKKCSFHSYSLTTPSIVQQISSFIPGLIICLSYLFSIYIRDQQIDSYRVTQEHWAACRLYILMRFKNHLNSMSFEKLISLKYQTSKDPTWKKNTDPVACVFWYFYSLFRFTNYVCLSNRLLMGINWRFVFRKKTYQKTLS
jgi:hypothetical protein